MPPHDDLVTRTIGQEPAAARSYGDGDRSILLVHGLASQSLELGQLPHVLAERGFHVLTPDLRGHGKSQGPRGVLDPDRVLEDLVAWRDHLEQDGRELAALGGHSLGGAWALMAAPHLDPDAVITVATPATIRAELTGIEHAAYRIGGGLHRLASKVGLDGLRVPYQVGPEDVLDDEDAIERMEHEDLIQPSVPLANVAPLLALDTASWAARASCPGLICVPTADRVVHRPNARTVYEAYAGPKDWLELPGPHSCFYGPTGKACSQPVASWIEGVLA